MQAHDDDCPDMPDLIIIDTMFRSIMGADENSAKDATWVLDSIQQLVEHTGAAVMLIHHVSRNGSERGSTSYKAAMESTIELKREKNNSRTMYCRKLKDGEEFNPQKYSLDSLNNSAIVKWLGEAPRAVIENSRPCVLGDIITTLQTSPERWWSVAAIAKDMNKDKGNLNRSLKDGCHKGLIEKQPGDGITKTPATYRVRTATTSKGTENIALSLSLSDNDSQ